MSDRPDIILPLGTGSVGGRDDELRLFLRSLERNGRNFGNVWIVGEEMPKWLRTGDGLAVLSAKDTHSQNKDANLFDKVLVALDRVQSEDVILCFDDCAVLRPVDFGNLQPIVNGRGVRDFSEGKRTRWRRRMLATLRELHLDGGNFDAHCPQRWNVAAAKKAIAATPYTAAEGRCIDTAVMGRIFGGIPAVAVPQAEVKVTVEDADAARRFAGGGAAWFLGYNDEGFVGGVRDWLFLEFAVKSRFERKEGTRQ